MKRWPYVVLPAALALFYGAAVSSCAAGQSISPTSGSGGSTATESSGTTSITGGSGGQTTTTTSSSASTGSTTSSTATGGSGGATSGTGGTGVTGGSGTGGSAPTDFLTPCQDDSECTSGVCIQMGDGSKACTIECTASMTCPNDGFRCSPLLTAQDTTRYCLPRFNDLCKPCEADADCYLQHNGAPVFDRAECEKVTSGIGANQTVAGSFCTTECNDVNLPCPSGYSCKGVVGSVVKHCIKDDQQCSCQPFWQNPTTTCSNTTVDGTCNGARGCMNGSLSACSAKMPAAEMCNGIDDNCNGTIDDGGNALCSNGGLACVTATCNGVGGCQTTVNAGFCVIGGSLCVVAGTVDPANQCQGCDPSKSTTGWSIRTGLSCNDNEPCTTGETCNAAGFCTGGTPTSCAAFGNPPCSMGVCQMGVGCVTMNNDGANCDDGLYCTVGEKCSGGVCGAGAGAGAARDCSALSALPCKTGVCNEATDQCVTQINQGTACDDGNPCSTTSTCNAAGACTGTVFKDCSAQSDTCNVGVCNTANGVCQKQAANIGVSCDDMNACTGNGVCANSGGVGVCSAGTAIGDSFEPNNTVGAFKAVTNIDDCGNATGSLSATINPGTDIDWYQFKLNNSSSTCDYGTQVTLVSAPGRDYDLLVCVFMSGGFSASCPTGSSVAAPAGLTGYSCCQSTAGTGVTDSIKVDWSCGTFCSDGQGTVYMRVTPKNGTQTAECAQGYTLTWKDD